MYTTCQYVYDGSNPSYHSNSRKEYAQQATSNQTLLSLDNSTDKGENTDDYANVHIQSASPCELRGYKIEEESGSNPQIIIVERCRVLYQAKQVVSSQMRRAAVIF